MTRRSKNRTAGVLAARIGLVLGGLVCLLVTPQFAMAYQNAYGSSQGESANAWIEQVAWPEWISGLDAVSTYNRYGVVFGLALALVAVCLGVVVRSRRGKGEWERRAWWLVVGGIGAVAVGALAEYGIPDDFFDPGYGFGLELVGFLLIMIGTPLLGWAAHREAGLSTIRSIGVGLIGPVGIIIGGAINGHLPGGPASPVIIAAMVTGIAGLPDTNRPNRSSYE